MTTRNLAAVFISIVILSACGKDSSMPAVNPPTNSNGNQTDNPNTYKPGNTLLIDDLVLYTTDGAHRDVQLIKDFMTRNFPDDVSIFDYGQSSVSYNNNALSLTFLDSNKVKLKDSVFEIVSKSDKEMMLSSKDSSDMPGIESTWLGHCMILYNQVPKYNAWSICNAAGGNCKKYRKQYPVMVSGKDYYLPLLKYALVSNCSIFMYDAAPMPNYLNENIINGMLQNKDSLLVQVSRLKVSK
ncbi:hypothetical protein A4D02_06495 [Niastella koreensis]|uniref:Lipoprotein n=2 Tax=Niastella koreensis TaxID=354356 RepID=G8TG45_NIAKG|nr:hypothetical protein [Niastella koreensis]AEW01648.1 hypothetical protein Niako_5411 [Niastella koreensis GR20-10]OQP48360.1 hypothetical protein A4D02_06495 [Niastella koreensis]